MCDHEVTEGEVETLAPGLRWILDPKLPVGLATWVGAVDYCEKLTEQERVAGRITADQVYRLPTEAEWEYAARAGTTALRYGPLDEIAWFAPTNATGPTPPQPGKQKAPNAWGLYDMIGGVLEWCSDRHELYPSGPVVDPQGPDGTAKASRVLRGGRRAADRYYGRPSDYYFFGGTGFRVVLTAGSGDTNAPTGAGGEIGAEPRIQVAPLRKVVVDGPPRSSIQVEYAAEASGPWTAWTNVLWIAGGVPLVDLAPESPTRFYRAVRDPRPPARPGFQWIPPGTFVMGSPTHEVGRSQFEVQHTVTLTRGFWMRERELVESDYQTVLGLDRQFTWGASWNEAVEYCHRLTEQERAVGRISFQEVYRLPTEAEWEYAARAGTTGPRYSDQFASVPNAWGLWNTIGGYEEWCSDWFGDYPEGPVTDPQGPATGTWRVLRGGMFANPPEAFRSASRSGFFPMNGFGLYKTFRPVLSSVW
jgi:formylglycine-generating enzyme required for sulfatase activity